MRKVIFCSIAAMLVTAPMATAVKAEDTTIIKRDGDGGRKVIEKRERTDVLPVLHTEEKTSLRKKAIRLTTGSTHNSRSVPRIKRSQPPLYFSAK
jgi:hypothetical protein